MKSFLQFAEVKGWDVLGDYEPEDFDHQALPAFPNGPPPVAPGMVRLYRGTKVGKLPHEQSFWSDERGLKGVAGAFGNANGRHLVYVDVPQSIAQQCLQTGCVTDGEYQNIPEKYRRQIRVY